MSTINDPFSYRPIIIFKRKITFFLEIDLDIFNIVLAKSIQIMLIEFRKGCMSQTGPKKCFIPQNCEKYMYTNFD